MNKDQETNYSGVTEDDFKDLEVVFSKFIEDSLPITMEHPELGDTILDFVTNVGAVTKTILQKYGQDNYVKGLEVEDYKNKAFIEKKKMVKMRLAVNNIEKACVQFINTKDKRGSK